MSELLRSNRRIYLALGVIAVLSVAFRLYHLEAKGLWMDEIHSTVGTDPDKTLAEVLEYCKQDQPPIYFVLLHTWFKAFSYNDYSGRLVALIVGVLGVLTMFFLGRELKNNQVGLMSSFLTAINYFHLDFSRQVRFYSLVFLFSALSYFFFIRIFKRQKPIDFILYALSTGALLNTHYFGMVVFVSQFILFITIIIWKRIRDRKFIFYSLASGVAAALTFAHWLPVVLSDLTIPQFHVAQVKWYFLAEFYYIYFRDIVICVIGAFLTVLALQRIMPRLKDKTASIEEIILLGWIILGFGIPLLYSILRMPMLDYKYSFIVLPAILLLFALGFDAFDSQRLKKYIIPVLFFSFLNTALFAKSVYYVPYPPEQWREAAKEIVKTDSPTQIVFSEYAWYFRYYFKIFHSANPPFEPRYADVPALLKMANSVWVLSSVKFPDPGLSPEQRAALEKDFRKVREFRLVDNIATQYIRR
jgi:mannosyltransferase